MRRTGGVPAAPGGGTSSEPQGRREARLKKSHFSPIACSQSADGNVFSDGSQKCDGDDDDDEYKFLFWLFAT